MRQFSELGIVPEVTSAEGQTPTLPSFSLGRPVWIGQVASPLKPLTNPLKPLAGSFTPVIDAVRDTLPSDSEQDQDESPQAGPHDAKRHRPVA